jgi:hypothetical protein
MRIAALAGRRSLSSGARREANRVPRSTQRTTNSILRSCPCALDANSVSVLTVFNNEAKLTERVVPGGQVGGARLQHCIVRRLAVCRAPPSVTSSTSVARSAGPARQPRRLREHGHEPAEGAGARSLDLSGRRSTDPSGRGEVRRDLGGASRSATRAGANGEGRTQQTLVIASGNKWEGSA